MKETLTLATQGHRFVTHDNRSYVGRAVVGISNEGGVDLRSERTDVRLNPDRQVTNIQLLLGSAAAKRLIDFYGDTHCGKPCGSYNCFSFTSWVTDGQQHMNPRWHYDYGHSRPTNDLTKHQAFAILDSRNLPIHSLLSLGGLKNLAVWGVNEPLVLSANPEAMRFYKGVRAMEMIRRDGSFLTTSD